MNTDNITDIEVDDIHGWDAPDFCDAYISHAAWKDSGKELTEAELDKLNENGSFVYQCVEAQVY